jgi:hypothetical protein
MGQGQGRAARAGQRRGSLSDKQGPARAGRAGRCFQLRLHLQTDQVMIEFK